MPKIPQYQQQTTAQATLSPRTLDTGGQDVVRGLAVVGAGAERMARSIHYVQRVEEQKADADSIAEINLLLTQGDEQWDKYTIDAQASTDDPAGSTGKHLGEFDKFSTDLIAKARTPKAKQFAQQQLAQQRSQLSTRWLQWETNKGLEHRATQYEQSLEPQAKALQSGRLSYDEAIEQAGVVLGNLALPRDITEKLWPVTKSRYAEAAVEGMLERNPSATLKALKSGKGSAIEALSAADTERLTAKAEAELERRAEAGFASMLVNTVRPMVASMPVGAGDMVDVNAAIAAARSRFGALSPERQLRLENYVEGAVRQREGMIRRGREMALAGAYDAVDQAGGDLEAVIASNPKVLEGLDREGRLRLDRYAGEVSTGATRQTDWKTYTQLIQDPTLLASTNLDSMRDRFNARELAQLQSAQEKLRSDPLEEQNILTTNALVKNMLDDAGFGKNEDAQARFYSILQQGMDQERALTGKKQISQQRISELAQDLLVREVTDRGVLWDSRETAFNIEVPETDRAKIVLSLMSQGLPASEYNILTAYRQKLQAAK